ncbi:MAG: ABC transporter ATP-binding protein [Myxococcales bacterium]|nr:ABC transporter ATP-binding protein [Myxococcales bacterium]
MIRANGVGKRYEMHRHRSMLLHDAAKMAFSKYEKNYFWALRNIDFEIRKGESVALIGPNGAGKSTLLSLIAKTVFPTEGSLTVEGRVSALLELGAGFHPHFTGRENILINGIVMGLTKAEIEARMDEIIAFSELEKFIDEPIQNYSSGMLARLGFSVAASVDPEILIVDEALSVGDAAFQEKSFQRILDFKRQGCTILFVTHALGNVSRFCDRALLLSHGQILEAGPAQDICDNYEARVREGRLDAPRLPYETQVLPLWKRVAAILTILSMMGVVIGAGIYFVLSSMKETAGMPEPNAIQRIKRLNENNNNKNNDSDALERAP